MILLLNTIVKGYRPQHSDRGEAPCPLVCARTVKLGFALLYGTWFSAEAPVPICLMVLENRWRSVCHGSVSGVGPGGGLVCRR